MKRFKLLALALILSASYNCKDAKKEEKVTEETKTEAYIIVPDSTKISFTAYKTTEKLPVGGKFLKIDFNKINKGATDIEALNGTNFSIPVSSLFTNDATGTRDPKLLEFFFGAMSNTELITGVFKGTGDNNCSIDVTLNGETGNIPLTLSRNDDGTLTFNGTMELDNWKALDALASLNKACKELHTGEDGVSKTWNDVAVQATVTMKKE